MLLRSGALPQRAGYAFELKWDGFRAIVSTEGELRVRSRRGWNMTPLVPELEALPARGVFDGELVAFGPDRLPSFPLLCQRILHGKRSIPIAFVIFDVLELDRESTMRLPLAERRARLEQLELEGAHWQISPLFDDGEALWDVVVDCGLEGIVAKRLSAPYRPGERDWIKVKNRGYWRFPLELAAAIRPRRDAVRPNANVAARSFVSRRV